jgi:glycosyltransferase involved in cell wall biosynthesis
MDTRAVAFPERPSEAVPERTIKVGVLVDLPLAPRAGGHVLCWERLARAALGLRQSLDLTVHFIGNPPERRSLGDNVRYIIEPPVFSTERLSFLSHVPDHTDLAPWHKRVARMLRFYDVIHTTDAYFAYARTAMRVAARRGIPLVNSVHTNTPEYARIFTALTIERLLGDGAAARFLLERVRLAERVEARMLRQLAEYQRRCAFALVSRPTQLEGTRALLDGRAALLRRGIDHLLFNPVKRDRGWLADAYGIPPERLVVLCVGKLNRGKNVLFLAEAMAALIAEGIDAHLLCAGDGEDRVAIQRRLGSRATCPGSIAAADLARHYASADLLAFPSRIEESANVVLEALASGLPVLVTRDGGMGRAIAEGETGFILPGDAAPWIEAIAMLATDRDRLQRMSRAARRHAKLRVPSWAEVLSEDLLPRWQEAAGLTWRARASAAA